MASQHPPPTSAMMMKGPPYLPTVWALGGVPKVNVDVPITAVFLFLFLISAATHMMIFRLNKARGHKYLLSFFTFAFSMARVVTCILRIATICRPRNIRLAIAASIFVSAGVLVLFVLQIILSQRVFRSMHPRIGWHPAFSHGFFVIYALIGFTLAIVITGVIQSFYTLRPRTRQIDRDLQLYGVTFLAVISTLPFVILGIAFAIPRKTRPERFGLGRFRTKVFILVVSSTLLGLGAWYRCGTLWKKPVPRTEPMPSYLRRSCFYVFIFMLEILTSYFWAIMRNDLRFWIPNGSKGPGDYERGWNEKKGEKGEKGEKGALELGLIRPAKTNKEKANGAVEEVPSHMTNGYEKQDEATEHIMSPMTNGYEP